LELETSRLGSRDLVSGQSKDPDMFDCTYNSVMRMISLLRSFKISPFRRFLILVMLFFGNKQHVNVSSVRRDLPTTATADC